MPAFLFQTIVISLFGVMAPGPITAVTIGTGMRSPYAGALVAVGHGIVEIPLMAIVFLGLGPVAGIPAVRAVVFALGGAVLIIMGADMLRAVRSPSRSRVMNSGAPLAAGMALSLGNAYFLVWWATVGASLITRAAEFGATGLILFAVVHWLCDFVWYSFLAVVSFTGKDILGVRFQRTVFAVCGVFLAVFGGMFIRDAVRILGGT